MKDSQQGDYRNCHLWKIDTFKEDGSDLKESFEHIETFVKDSHWWRYLLRCKKCSQLYLQEFYEEVDWQNGNDPQFITYIPVESQRHASLLSHKKREQLRKVEPRIEQNWPADQDFPEIFWVR